MAGSARPGGGHRRDDSRANVGRPVGPHVPGLITRNDERHCQMLVLSELLDDNQRPADDEHLLRLLRMLMDREAKESPGERAAHLRSSRKGSSKGKGKWRPPTASQGAPPESSDQVLRQSAELELAIRRKDWVKVNDIIQSPQEVWMLACSESGSRQLQQLVKTSSDTEQAAFKSAVDKVIAGLQSHVLEATATCGTWNFSNYVLSALIEALPVERFTFILEEMKNQVVNVALDPQGCRVLQRLLEHVLHMDQHARSLLNELTPHLRLLAVDRFGTHVVQKLLEQASPGQKRVLAQAFLELGKEKGALRELSCKRHSSWVLEKLINSLPAGIDCELWLVLRALDLELEAVAPSSGRKAKKSEYGSFVHRTVRKKQTGSPRPEDSARFWNDPSAACPSPSPAMPQVQTAVMAPWYPAGPMVFQSVPLFWMPSPDSGGWGPAPYAVQPPGMWRAWTNN